jgi:hypothetical protein
MPTVCLGVIVSGLALEHTGCHPGAGDDEQLLEANLRHCPLNVLVKVNHERRELKIQRSF